MKILNIRNKHATKVLVLTIGLLCGQAAQGAEGWIGNAKIIRTLADAHYGGCMVNLDIPANSSGLNCPTSWVSLDCDGVIHTQAQANAMWSSALMAFSLNKTVNIYLDDTNKTDGDLCIGRRIDVFLN